MVDLPHPWGAYGRLQSKLSRRQQIGDYAWGLEAGLNRLLEPGSCSDEEADRAVRSVGRKERYRAGLRDAHLGLREPTEIPNGEDALDARRRLRLIRGRVTQEQFALLRAVAVGHEYVELAAASNVAPGTLRVRVLRLRRSLGALEQPADTITTLAS